MPTTEHPTSTSDYLAEALAVTSENARRERVIREALTVLDEQTGPSGRLHPTDVAALLPLIELLRAELPAGSSDPFDPWA